MQFLRQSTASQVVRVGPFVDDTDFKTPETALTIANTDIKLFSHTATSTTNKNSGGATHVANGWYHLTLNAADTATVGRLDIYVAVAGALQVWKELTVLPASVYDALVAGSGNLPVDAVQWAGAATATGNVALKSTLAKGTDITGFNDLSAAQVNAEADTAIADAALATASGLATVNSNVVTVASTLGAPAGASIAADIATRASQTSVDTVDSVVDAILDDTGTSGVVVAAGSKTGYSLASSQAFNLTGNVTGNVSGSVGSVTAPVAIETGGINDATLGTITELLPADVKRINGTAVTGAGTAGNEWRPA